MEIDITSSEGNIFTALGIATQMMRKAKRDKGDIERLREKVMGAADYKSACAAITDATFGCITFHDPRKDD